jgi:serine/threonine-protein kinase
MAEVWAAEDTELGRRVAIKILGRDSDRDRFAREARAVAALSHPSVCQLYDYGATDDDRPYMVLEYLSGGSLEDRLQANRPLDDADTYRIATEISAGLAHAHARGLIHRDLKPANVLFDAEGRAKIADFGIARIGTEGTLTEAGTVLGTAAYISPEQAAGEPATAASDVYSFGVILYRLVAGRLPFESASALELVRMHQTEDVPPITDFRSDPPPALEALALASLQKDPAARPPDGEALTAELGLGAPTELITAGGATQETGSATQVIAAPPPGDRVPRPRRRLAPVAGVLALLLVAGGALAVVATREPASGRDEAPLTTDEFGLPTVGTIKQTGPRTTLATTETEGEVTTDEQPTTPRATTTARTTTRPATTSAPPPRTRPTTTRPATTAPPPTFTEPIETVEPPPTTTVPPTTTEPPPATTTVPIP